MKSEVTRELNRISGIEAGGNTVEITPENLPKKVFEINPKEFKVLFDGENGIRIINDGSSEYTTKIEVKSKDGWVQLSGVQSIKFELSVDCLIPKVTIEQYILRDHSKK